MAASLRPRRIYQYACGLRSPPHCRAVPAKGPCRRQEPSDQAVSVRRNYSLTNTKLSAKHNHSAQYLQLIAVMARSGGSKGWEGEGGSPAATWPSSTSLVMPLLTRHGQTNLPQTHPAWGKSRITTSHLFQDAPRDDGYYWMGDRDKVFVGLSRLKPNKYRSDRRVSIKDLRQVEAVGRRLGAWS